MNVRNHRTAYWICCALFGIYLVEAVNIVYLPIRAGEDWPANVTLQNASFILAHVNLIPFNFGNLFSSNAYTIFEQLVGNVVFTVPFGFLLPFITRVSTRRMLWLSACVGLALEGGQLLFKLCGLVNGYGHSVDINDALLNALGVMVGYALFRAAASGFLALTARPGPRKRGFWSFMEDVARAYRSDGPGAAGDQD